MKIVKHLTLEELEGGLNNICQSPKEIGLLEMIVSRPAENERDILDKAELDLIKGLIGDRWFISKSNKTPDGSPHPEKQINIMNSRVISLISQDKERWSLAGDQLYIDMDLGTKNLPPGTKLSIGTAIIEVTNEPHTGCSKFGQRFGTDAMKFVNSLTGRELNLRGINAKVVQSGIIRPGDTVKKI